MDKYKVIKESDALRQTMDDTNGAATLFLKEILPFISRSAAAQAVGTTLTSIV